jgi:uncharacterized membrane protein YebE (DUF533 family)
MRESNNKASKVIKSNMLRAINQITEKNYQNWQKPQKKKTSFIAFPAQLNSR